jgi:hypothetical protein
LTGELDFYVNGSHGWGFELMVCGVRATIWEHMDRFEDGKYSQLQCNDALVVDFRSHSQHSPAEYLQNDLYAAVTFDSMFTVAKIQHTTHTLIVNLAP